MTAATTDVIRRKIHRSRPTQAEGAPGADRGWRLALARAARDAMGLDLEFRSLTIARRSLAEILDLVPDRALLALLDGPMGGLGVILLAPMVTATFIEKQTLGRLSAQPPAPRKASRIDAAMVAGVIDRALAGLDEVLAEEADLIWAGGFRYASYLEDARPLALMLEEAEYRVLAAEVALGGGGREGRVILVLPAVGRGVSPAVPMDETAVEAPQFTAALSAQVMQADCRLDAVSLETPEGRHVAPARLGQHRGMRAMKLGETVTARTAAPVPLRSPAQTLPQDPVPDLRAAG